MTANHAHTPTTQDVQWAAITTTFEDSSITEDAFNRWLDARDARIEAAAEQRGAIKALRDAANDLEYLAAQIDPTLEGAEMYAKAGQEIIQTLRDRAENYHLQHGADDDR